MGKHTLTDWVLFGTYRSLMLLTARQIRAARALVNLTQREVAKRTGVSEPTLKRIESDDWGPGRSGHQAVAAVQMLLEAAGAEFLPAGQGHGEGVRRQERE